MIMRRRSKKETISSFPFSFDLMLPGRKKLAGNLADVNMEGAAISFPVEQCPALKNSERIRLALTIFETKKTMLLDAVVNGSRTVQDRILFQFRFIDTTHILKDPDPVLSGYFNRRESFRVRPDLSEPIRVSFKWEGKSVEGSILDISLTGIGLALEPKVARQLEYAKQITMTFRLPDETMPFEIVGNTTNFIPVGKLVRYGIQFDRKETMNIRNKERRILKYIMQRQLVMLKKRSGIETAPAEK